MSQGAENRGWTAFDTAMGTCAIAWQGTEVVRFSLPEENEATLEHRMDGVGSRAEAPAVVESVIHRARRHLAGDPQFFGDVVLRFEQASVFQKAVYAAARQIMVGEVLTYGELAARLGKAGAARAVGHALGKNLIPLIVPCHRVVGVNRNLGGFSAHGGLATKRRLLEIEGIVIPEKRRQD